MKKFRGWKEVFTFTFRQGVGTKGYKIVTTLIALAMLGIAMLVTVLSAKPDKNDDSDVDKMFSSVNKVYVVNQTTVGDASYEEWSQWDDTDNKVHLGKTEPIPFEEWIPELTGSDYYNYVIWETVNDLTMTEDDLAVLVAQDESNGAVGVLITNTESTLEIRAIVPSTSYLELEDGQEISDIVASCIEKKRANASGLTEFQMKQLMKPITLSITEAGEDTGVITYLIQYLAPLLFGLILYFMLLLYGQTICQEVSTEKTSKLMETLLTSLHPYALLTGKVFAIACTAMLQFFIWIVAGIAGLVGGVELGRIIYPETDSTVGAMITFLRDNIGETAFSPAAVILAFIIFCCGFLFYCVLSGMAGSMVNRPEEASSVAAVFTFPILISWLVTYLGTLTENATLLVVARYIPFTIPFCIPVELLTGTTGIVQGLISTGILLVFSIIIIMISARIYRGLVLYTGQKMSLKAIIGVIRNK